MPRHFTSSIRAPFHSTYTTHVRYRAEKRNWIERRRERERKKATQLKRSRKGRKKKRREIGGNREAREKTKKSNFVSAAAPKDEGRTRTRVF